MRLNNSWLRCKLNCLQFLFGVTWFDWKKLFLQHQNFCRYKLIKRSPLGNLKMWKTNLNALNWLQYLHFQIVGIVALSRFQTNWSTPVFPYSSVHHVFNLLEHFKFFFSYFVHLIHCSSWTRHVWFCPAIQVDKSRKCGYYWCWKVYCSWFCKSEFKLSINSRLRHFIAPSCTRTNQS